MHTIKWMARELGVTPGTLRAWEERYGVVRPARSEAGYRLYDDSDLAVLGAMVRLVSGGMKPAQAADEVREIYARPRHTARSTADASSGLPDPRALITASQTYDVRALEDALDNAFGAAGFERAVDGWLMAAMEAVGDAWESGEMDVGQEHFVSAGVMRRLAASFDAAGHARSGPHVVIGLVPEATHEIATLAFATMVRRAGLPVTYMGPDLPVDSWVDAVCRVRPAAVVIGAPRPADTDAASAVARALEETGVPVAVFVGGPGAPPEYALMKGTLSESSDWLVRTLLGL